MNVDFLYKHFSTSPSHWTQKEVAYWLQLLNMKEYQPEFEINKVDGLIIFDLEDKEMEEILNIKNSIHRKRLRNGIVILRQFRDDIERKKKKTDRLEGLNNFNDNNMPPPTSIINSQPAKVMSIKNNNHFLQFNSQTAQRRELENIFNSNALANFEAEMSFPGPKIYSQEPCLIEEEKAPETINLEAYNSLKKSNHKSKSKNRRPDRIYEQAVSDKGNFGQSHSNPSSMNIEEEGPKNIGNQSGSKRIRKSLSAVDEHYGADKENEVNPMGGHRGSDPLVGHENGQGDVEMFKQHPAELIIQPVDSVQSNNFYCINEKGGRIGRHSDNEIVILEESVSRYHAVIEFRENKFYLVDRGSTTGSFIKIVNPLVLEEGMIVELGSNQFYVNQIILKDQDNGELVLKVIEGMHMDREFIIENTATIGRKGQFSPSTIALVDDLHLSNTHTKITYMDSKFILEDLGSTNGSWLRMSRENIKSMPFELCDGMVFKIGASSTFKVKRSNMNYLEMLQSPKNVDGTTNCVICYEEERDVVFRPCNHNVACLKCSKNVKQCPMCRMKINDIIRIYKP